MSIYYFFAEKMFRNRFEYVSPPFSPCEHRTLFPSVRSTLCHCEAPLCGAVAISRKGHRIKPPQDTFVPVGKIGDPAGYFCTRGERRVHKIRICRSVILRYRKSGDPKRYICTCVEEKEHTSKRVSIIAPDNVISKVQCATCCPNQTLK